MRYPPGGDELARGRPRVVTATATLGRRQSKRQGEGAVNRDRRRKEETGVTVAFAGSEVADREMPCTINFKKYKIKFNKI